MPRTAWALFLHSGMQRYSSKLCSVSHDTPEGYNPNRLILQGFSARVPTSMQNQDFALGSFHNPWETGSQRTCVFCLCFSVSSRSTLYNLPCMCSVSHVPCVVGMDRSLWTLVLIAGKVMIFALVLPRAWLPVSTNPQESRCYLIGVHPRYQDI